MNVDLVDTFAEWFSASFTRVAGNIDDIDRYAVYDVKYS